MTQVLCVAGARPNFMKIAPVMAALAETGITAQLLHTGQHYDAAMSDSFFADLGIPRPDHHLEVGSGSHAESGIHRHNAVTTLTRTKPSCDHTAPSSTSAQAISAPG